MPDVCLWACEVMNREWRYECKERRSEFIILLIPALQLRLLFLGCFGDVECDEKSVKHQSPPDIYRQRGGPVINAVPCATSKEGLDAGRRRTTSSTAAPPAASG